MEQQPRNGEVAIRDFTAGLVDIIDDNLIPDGAALKADNCISRTIGKLSKRRGYKADHPTPLSGKKIQGMFAYYNNAGIRRVIVANNGKIYSYNREESEFTQLLSGRADTTEKFASCIINGKDSIIGFNGVDHPYIWDGESATATRLENYRKVQDEVLSTSDYKVYTAERGEWKPHGVIVTSNGEVLSEEDYTLDAVGGRIIFPEPRINEVTRERAIEWLSFTKFTTQHPIKPGSDSNTIVYDKDNNIVPSGLYTIVYDDGNRGAIVFKTSQMTKAPLRVSYQWVDVIKADYQYKAGGEEIETEMRSMRLPAIYNGRVFVSSSISDRTSQIWFSEPNEPENWPPINYWEIKPGDGDIVTNLVAFMGQLVVFKRRSIHIFQGKSFNDFRLEEVDPRVGCVGPNAAVTHSMRMYFVGEGGLYEFNGLKAKNLVAEKIPQFWSTVNLGHIDKAVVTVWNELVLTALPVGSEATENNTVLVYDTRTGAFWKWTNMPISCYCITSDATSQVLLSGHNAEGTVCQQDVGDTDMGEPIVAVWEPRAIDLGAPERIKKIKRCFLEEAPDMETHATFCLSPDYEDFTELTFYGSDGGVRMYRIPRELRRFRYIVPRITHSGAGEYEVRSIMFPYKLKRKPKVRRSVDDAPPVIPEEPTEPEDTRPVLFHDDCNSTEGWIQMYPQYSYGSLESDGSCIYSQQELDVDRYCADGLYIKECEIGDIDFEAEFQVKVGPIQAGERFEMGLVLASSDQENVIGVMIETDLMWDADAESLVTIVAGWFYGEPVEMNISADITVKIVKTGNKAELYIDNALIADCESADIGTLDVAYVCFVLHKESEMIDEPTFTLPAIYDIKVFGIALDEEGVT